MSFFELFFKDADLVEKSQIDLSATANSQDTEPDSDDEMTQLQSEAEPIRQSIIEVLNTIFQNFDE